MKNLIHRSMLVLTLLAFNLPAIRAQQPITQPVPVVVTPRVTEYKVIDMQTVTIPAGATSAKILESMLNELGAQGWVLVTASGPLYILRR